MLTAEGFTRLIKRVVTEMFEKNSKDNLIINKDRGQAKIDPAYSGTGRPALVFPGETEASKKTYPYNGVYTPVAGDLVIIMRLGETWFIVGPKK